jgi:hypothetical protein
MSKHTAIIIETRQHPALKFVLNNIIENLSNDWSIIIFHGTNNIDYVQSIVSELDQFRIKKIINLGVSTLTAKTYSDIFKNINFYSNIPTDIFLVFQTDSMILSENKQIINEFLGYDYVGSPWHPFASKYHMNDENCKSVGNGGFSLRRKSKMVEIIKKKGYMGNNNEDIYFCFDIPDSVKYNRPSFEKAKQFSIETIFYESPFSIHNFWSYLMPEHINIMFNKYPQIKILKSLQL